MNRCFCLRLSPYLVWAIAIPSLIAATAGATTPIAVNSFEDEVDANPSDGVCLSASSGCTLRAAVMTADSLDGFNIIQLQSGTYTLTLTGEGPLVSSDDLRINGVPGTVIEGDTGWSHQILVTTDGDLEVFRAPSTPTATNLRSVISDRPRQVSMLRFLPTDSRAVMCASGALHHGRSRPDASAVITYQCQAQRF